MDMTIPRLARDVAAKVRPLVMARSRQVRRWLTAPRDPITWAALRARGARLIYPLSGTYAGRLAAAGIFFLLLLVLPWYTQERSWISEVWDFYSRNKDALTPLLAPLGTILVGIGTITVGIGTMRVSGRQARTAAQQAQIAERAAVTTAFYNAVSRLASEKVEERVGGIYMLEQISKESPRDYWTVMETLTAFVRERTQRTEAERLAKPIDERIKALADSLWENAGRPEGRREECWAAAVAQEKYGEPPAADVAAVLTVIKRRSADRRELESALDFRGAVLRHANLGWRGSIYEEALVIRRDSPFDARVYLGADHGRAHFEAADLSWTHLEAADLIEAHLEGANLQHAHLQDANLWRAHLRDAYLSSAHLNGAIVTDTRLDGAILTEAHLEGTDLSMAKGLTQEQIHLALGDAETRLPEGLRRPAHWTAPQRMSSAVNSTLRAKLRMFHRGVGAR
jgi:hypothetical protein